MTNIQDGREIPTQRLQRLVVVETPAYKRAIRFIVFVNVISLSAFIVINFVLPIGVTETQSNALRITGVVFFFTLGALVGMLGALASTPVFLANRYDSAIGDGEAANSTSAPRRES